MIDKFFHVSPGPLLAGEAPSPSSPLGPSPPCAAAAMAQAPGDALAERSLPQPAEPSAPQPAERSAPQPAERSVPQPAERSVHQPQCEPSRCPSPPSDIGVPAARKTVKTKKRKTVKTKTNSPEPMACGVGTSYAAFTPLSRDINEPEPADDPFGESFAAAGDDDCWQYGDDDGQASVDEDDDKSWSYDSMDTSCFSSDDDDGDMAMSSSPGRRVEDDFHALLSRRRKVLCEHKSLYTGPQLVLDDDDEDG